MGTLRDIVEDTGFRGFKGVMGDIVGTGGKESCADCHSVRCAPIFLILTPIGGIR